jgi:hypothetical protein
VQGAPSTILTNDGNGNLSWASSSSTVWTLDGNSNGALKTIGTNDAYDLPVVTGGTERMRITSGGNVGIGTTSPTNKLHIVSDSGIRVDGTDGGIILTSYNASASSIQQLVIKHNMGDVEINNLRGCLSLQQSGNNVGIGTTNPIDKLQIHGSFTSTGLYEGAGIYFSTSNGTNQWGVAQITPYIASNNGGADGYPGGLEFKTKNPDKTPSSIPTTKMVIDATGNVGIGTTTPDQKLTVKGKIHAEEVIVDLNVPADYVFAKGYNLMPLHTVEQYVQQNSHLPDVPSAAEIKEKGLSMGEMQNKLLQKVEELTLYAIELQKRIDALEKAASPQPLHRGE